MCWLLFLVAVAACVFLNRIYPFSLLFDIDMPGSALHISNQDGQVLRFSIYGVTALCGIGFLFLARSLACIRQKNHILNMAGSRIKTLVGQHLERKAAIDALEQRHFGELPAGYTTDVNAISNPGYDTEEGIIS